MSSVIETIESAIITLAQGISYLSPSAGGTLRGVADIRTFMDITTVAPPGVIVVFDGERATEDMAIGGAVQQTELHWTFYVIAQSFGGDGEGRVGTVGAYQMIDDLIEALEGKEIYVDNVLMKLFYKGAIRAMNPAQSPSVVIYEVKFRHQYQRMEQ